MKTHDDPYVEYLRQRLVATGHFYDFFSDVERDDPPDRFPTWEAYYLHWAPRTNSAFGKQLFVAPSRDEWRATPSVALSHPQYDGTDPETTLIWDGLFGVVTMATAKRTRAAIAAMQQPHIDPRRAIKQPNIPNGPGYLPGPGYTTTSVDIPHDKPADARSEGIGRAVQAMNERSWMMGTARWGP